MTVFVISRIQVRDAEKLRQYAAAVAPTIAAFGGKVVLRGSFAKSLLGESDPHGTGIMEFPDMAAVEAWFGSETYQTLVPLRNEACDMTLFAYQGPSA